MKTFDIVIPVTFCALHELDEQEQQLVAAANKARSRAYAPFSQFKVGVALRLENGETVAGSNQENEAFPSGMCAERVALFYANSQYPKSAIVAIAVAATTTEPVCICGACRQALLQSERRYGKKIKVLMVAGKIVQIVNSVEELLPLSFRLSSKI
ncbi:MAG: cytidine deaminase [Prevotellaceae bacterium]|jgi:cytidine deaminase|nr:cytidine deaminase [Prevotellaceae bacterium]